MYHKLIKRLFYLENPKFMKRISFIILSLVAAVLLSGSFLMSCRHGVEVTAQKPVRVEVSVPVSSVADASRVYSGTVESGSTTPVSFSVPGTISHVYVAEGQRVAKGQIIARVKSGSLENANNIAQATLEEATDAYGRMKKLHDAGALPEIKWVAVQSELKQASNAAEIAARELSDATIYSPVSGAVSRKLADVGQNVMPGVPVVTIVSLDDINISIPVPENEIGMVNVGDAVTVEFTVPDTVILDGRVDRKSVVADPLTRTYAVKIDIADAGRKILPGMTGTVNMRMPAERVRSVVLPSRAVLLSADNRNFVWIVRDGKAERRYVTIGGFADSGAVSLSDGVAAGDSVIVAGMGKVSTGTPVEVIMENAKLKDHDESR